MEKVTCPKHLVVFDFDHTVIEHDSYSALINLITDEAVKKEFSLHQYDWNTFNNLLFTQLRKEGIDYSLIKQALETLKLNSYFKHLFEFLKNNEDLFHVVVVSGSLDIIIEWVLEYNGYRNLVKHIYCNEARKDSSSFIKFVEKETKSCEICNFSMCKALVINDVLSKNNFEKIFYVGDGLNDYCAALKLKDGDVLFPRKDFDLYKKIFHNDGFKKLECEVVDWEDAMKILEYIKTNV
jgi:pyridoxal phosphate phosphatase PHOSPHO2